MGPILGAGPVSPDPGTIGRMPALSRQQLVILVLLTIFWGINWPIMKAGVQDFPPLTFRALSMWLGVPVLGAVRPTRASGARPRR